MCSPRNLASSVGGKEYIQPKKYKPDTWYSNTPTPTILMNYYPSSTIETHVVPGIHFSRECSVGYTGIQGIFGRRTERTEVAGTGIGFEPNHTGVFGKVLRSFRTLRMTSVEYLPSKHTRYTLLRTLPKTHFLCTSRRSDRS